MVTKTYKGPWIIEDNGYLKWSTTVPPIKVTANEMERRWSHWLESLRKDVECTFGILKGRWRILKSGIRLEGMEETNNIWKTCCALHNWLLEIDGIDCEWEGEIGQHDANVISRTIPFAMQRLQLGFDPRSYDASGMGPGEDSIPAVSTMETENVGEQIEQDIEGVRIVRHLSLRYFREKLINHFDNV